MVDVEPPVLSLLDGALARPGWPRHLAVLRIVMGAVAVGKGLSFAFELGVFGGSNPWDGSAPLLAFWLSWMAGAVALLVGTRPQLAAGALAALLAAGWWSVDLYHNHQYLLFLVLVLLTFTPTGCASTFGRSAAGTDPDRPVAGWTLFLLGCQLSIVYGFSAVAKVNTDFLSGMVLHHLQDTGLFDLPVIDLPAVLVGVAVTVVVLEAFLAVAVWVPRLRPFAFGCAVPLHLGMATIARHELDFVYVGLFALTMFVLYASFLEPRPRSRTLVWDDRPGARSAVRRRVRRLARIDVCRTTTFVGAATADEGLADAARSHGVALVDVRGTVHVGIEAVDVVLAGSPLTFLVAPWRHLPVVRSVLRRRHDRSWKCSPSSTAT